VLTLDGRQYRKSLGTTEKKTAKERLAEFRLQLEQRHHAPVAVSTEANIVEDVTFEELSQRWLDSISGTLKPNSAKRRESAIKSLTPYFRNKFVGHISRLDVERWVNRRSPQCAALTFNKERDALSLIFH
jgi:hypothetical protein